MTQNKKEGCLIDLERLNKYITYNTWTLFLNPDSNKRIAKTHNPSRNQGSNYTQEAGGNNQD